MICKDCKSAKIRTRKNYTHGRKSRAVITHVCKECGSVNIEAARTNNKKGRWQRR